MLLEHHVKQKHVFHCWSASARSRKDAYGIEDWGTFLLGSELPAARRVVPSGCPLQEGHRCVRVDSLLPGLLMCGERKIDSLPTGS